MKEEMKGQPRDKWKQRRRYRVGGLEEWECYLLMNQPLRWSASFTLIVLSMNLLPFNWIAFSKWSLFSHNPNPIPLENPFSSLRIRTKNRLTPFSLK